MGFVNIDSLEVGMILASDLLTPEGRFLLPKGHTLEESAIKTCKAWGVRQADVHGLDQEQLNDAKLAQFDPEHLEQSRMLLAPLFRCANTDHPAMREIIRITLERTARQLAAKTFVQAAPAAPEPPAAISDSSVTPEEGARAALRLVRSQAGLISLPATFFKIMEVMESPFSSAMHIAEVVGKDSSLTAKLLKLVNSAFYGFPSKVDSISRAVALVGTKELTSLALGISVIGVFDGIPAEVMNMEGFWRHSIGCGVYASLISANNKNVVDETFFVAGLLHDIGRLLMLKSMPLRCLDAMVLSRSEGIPLFQAEQRLLGFDHARVGGILCKEWRMPVSLEQMVRYHHDPSNSKQMLDAGVVHLANLLVIAAGIGGSGEGVFPALHPKVWAGLKLNPGDLFPMVQQAQRQVDEIIRIFLGKGE